MEQLEGKHLDEIQNVMSAQQAAWVDATCCEGLDDVRDIPDVVPLQGVDEGMICDIQRVISRLVSKAPQLIGIKMIQYLCIYLSLSNR